MGNHSLPRCASATAATAARTLSAGTAHEKSGLRDLPRVHAHGLEPQRALERTKPDWMGLAALSARTFTRAPSYLETRGPFERSYLSLSA